MMKHTEKPVITLIEELKETFVDRLASIILHGSYLKDSFIKGTSDVNIIVVIKDLNSEDLDHTRKIVKKWMKTKNPAPVFMDLAEWYSSNDVYALEYSDIKENYRILAGEDIVEPMTLSPSDIRFQCESEIKHHLIRLRTLYSTEGDCSKALNAIIRKTISSYMTIIRGTLRTLGVSIPADNNEVLDIFTEKSSIYSGLFSKILEKRSANKKFHPKESEEIIKRLIDVLSEMLKFVNDINPEKGE